MTVTRLPGPARKRLPPLDLPRVVEAMEALQKFVDLAKGQYPPDILACALLLLAKNAFRHAPGYGRRGGAVLMHLTANRLEHEKDGKGW